MEIFNNESFKGIGQKIFVTALDFDWNGEDPIPGINGNCFSIRYFYKPRI
jgi:hypothetical protein